MNVFSKRLAMLLTVLMLLIACVGCSGAPEEASAPVTTGPSYTVATTTTQSGAMNSEVNVRKGPGFDQEVLGGVAAKESIVIVGREGDWYKVQFGDGYGYVNAHYVDVTGASNASQMAASRVTAPPTTTAATTLPGATTTAGGTTVAGATTTTAGGTTAAATIPTAANGIPDTQANDTFTN